MSADPIPKWLPAMLNVSPWTATTYDMLYAVFMRDLVHGKLSYMGFNVWFYPDKEEDGRMEIFWHLTSRENKSVNPPERFPDFRRCERLSWIKPMILRCPCPTGDVKHWDYEEGDGTIQTYVWLQRHDFLIIMKKLPDGRRRLITAFYLDYENARRKTCQKWERRIA